MVLLVANSELSLPIGTFPLLKMPPPVDAALFEIRLRVTSNVASLVGVLALQTPPPAIALLEMKVLSFISRWPRLMAPPPIDDAMLTRRVLWSSAMKPLL